MKKQLLLLVMFLLPMVASADAVEIDGIFYNMLQTVEGNIAIVTSNPNGYTGNLNIPASITSEGVQYNVISIGNNAFSNCRDLMSINLSEGLIEIGYSAFQNCASLITITIPNSVINISPKSFEGCSGLVSVSIGKNVNSIGASAFSGCYSLAAVHISDIEAWCKIDFNVEWVDYNNGKISNPLTWAKHLFLNGQEITELVIPNSITSIKDGVFYGWENLSAITIPNSVISIGQYALGYCGLTSLYIPNSVTIIDNNAFCYCTKLSNISIGKGVTTINKQAFLFCYSMPSIILPNCVIDIGDEAFRNCRSLSNIVIPDGVKNISFRAFMDCTNLKSITLPSQLLTIRDQAFRDCHSIESITIPSSTQVIYQQAFDGCTLLNQINALPTTPPFLYENSFPNFSARLKVSKGCKEAYQAAPGWKNFTNISDADKYKLTYIVDSEEYKSYEIEEGEVITSEALPTKEGYTFSGWSEIPETMPAKDVTVVGTFTVNKYKLTYTVDGEEYKSSEVEYGATITPEAFPTKEGYTFSGWSEIPETMPAKDVTVVGTFIVNRYKLTYMIDNEVYKVVEYDYGATITPEGRLEGDYVTFVWKDVPETMPAKDVTIYADYETGIAEVLMAQGIKYIYAPNGKRIEKLQKGLNIVVMNDGTVRKVVVK